MKISEINKLGKELELYTTIDYIGKGFPIILPRGAKVIKFLRNNVENLLEQNGFKAVRTPSMSNAEIYKVEDRYQSEKQNLFIVKDSENEIVLKPYVQPFHCSIFKLGSHSYKELPIKYCETSTVFRNECDLKGIMRTRQVTLSDASVFCEASKVKNEIKDLLKIQLEFVRKIGISMTYRISLWDTNHKEDYIGNIDEWDSVAQAMKESLDELGLKYEIDTNAKMFGPSISLYFNEIEFSVLQVDFEITHRFELKYTAKDTNEYFPMYMHHTIVGSYENLLNILIEKYQGEFPFWMAPVQAVVISDGEEYDDYATEIKNKLQKIIKIEMDNSQSSIQNKIEKNLKLKVPIIIEVGKEELNSNTLKALINNVEKNYEIEELTKEVINWQTKF